MSPTYTSKNTLKVPTKPALTRRRVIETPPFILRQPFCANPPSVLSLQNNFGFAGARAGGGGGCHAGWYCPSGTVDPFSLACGSPTYFCPEGSGRSLPVDRGFYAGGGADREGRPAGHSFQVKANRRCSSARERRRGDDEGRGIVGRAYPRLLYSLSVRMWVMRPGGTF